MAGLGLTNAVQAGIDAERTRRYDDRQQVLQGREDEAYNLTKRANEAGAAIAGDKPDGFSIIKAFDARGRVLLEGGDFEGFMKNEAVAASARLKQRAQVLQKFQADGDFERFTRDAYETLPDGDSIEKVERVKGGEAGPQGAPQGPDMVRLTTKGGRVILKRPEEIVQGVRNSLIDPMKTAEQEAKVSLETTLQAIKTQGKVVEAKAKGVEDRQTEEVKQAGRKEIVGLQGANQVKVANIHAGATVKAAGMRAGGGGGADGGARVQKTLVDSDGYVTAVFRDGTTKRLEINGKPVRSNDWQKRVDATVNQMRKSIGGFGKTEDELRQAAIDSITNGGGGEPQAPGLEAGAPPTLKFDKDGNLITQ